MEKKKSTVKKVLSIIGNILITVYIIVALLLSAMVFTSMKTGYPSLFGYSVMHVLTDSMEGDAEDAIFEGDLVLCKKQDDYLSLEDGQIIAYRVTLLDENDQAVEIVRIHRIVGRDEGGVNYITKGDNTPAVDEVSVNPDYILGVYNGTRIPTLGNVIEFMQSQNGILIFLVIPMALFFLYALYKFIKSILEYKMSKSPAGELSEEQKQKAIEEYLAKQASEQANNDAPAEESNNNSESDE